MQKKYTLHIVCIIIGLFFFNILQAQDTLRVEVSPWEHFYYFDSKYLNLKTLEWQTSVDVPAQSFRSGSKFTPRFKGLSIDKIGYKGKLFQITPNNGLSMLDLITQVSVALPNKEKTMERYNQNFLLGVHYGVVYVKYLNQDNGYLIYKYDEKGTELFEVQLPHTRFIKKEKLEYYRPYLGYLCHTHSDIVFSSYDPAEQKTFVIDAWNGSVDEYDFQVQGVIRDQQLDSDILGFVRVDQQAGQLIINYKAKEFKLDVPKLKGDPKRLRVETVLGKDAKTLSLAVYDGAATGILYFAGIDVETEQVVWEKKPQALKDVDTAGYYYSTVYLSAYGNNILLEAYEKSGRYLQIFDYKTGNYVKGFGDL